MLAPAYSIAADRDAVNVGGYEIDYRADGQQREQVSLRAPEQ